MMRRFYNQIIASENTRARNMGVPGILIVDEWIDLCRQYGNVCLRCGIMDMLSPDHVTPLTRKGTNFISNIQPLCLPCNNRKRVDCTDYRSESRDTRLARWRKLRIPGALQRLPESKRILAWTLQSGGTVRIEVLEHSFHVHIDNYKMRTARQIVPLSTELQQEYAQHGIVATVASVGLTSERRDTLLEMHSYIQHYIAEHVDKALDAYIEALNIGAYALIAPHAYEHAEQIKLATNFSF